MLLVVTVFSGSQVKAQLHGKEWIWVGDKFLSSDRIAFEAPAGSDLFLRAVSYPVECDLVGRFSVMSMMLVPVEPCFRRWVRFTIVSAMCVLLYHATIVVFVVCQVVNSVLTNQKQFCHPLCCCSSSRGLLSCFFRFPRLLF